MKRKERDKPGKKSIPKHTKLALGSVATELALDGMSIPKVQKLYEKAGYKLGTRTLERYIQCNKATKPQFKLDDKRGAKPLLSPAQQKILVGYVLVKNSLGKPVSRTKCKDFVLKAFHVDLTLQSISNYLHRNGLSLQVMGSRELAKVKSYEDYVKAYVAWIQAAHQSGFFICESKLLCSIDFFSGSRRMEREKSFSPRGAKQLKILTANNAEIKYTNCYLSVLWADGVNRTPVLLFTYNSDLNPLGKNRESVLKWCQEFGISPARIFYKKSQKLYYAEDTDMVFSMLQKYDEKIEWKNVHMLRDAGNVFKKKGHDIFEDGWSEEVIVYESICHGELSPNDNSFHASVKTKWRVHRGQYRTEAQQDLYLLSLCDKVPPKEVTVYFDRNLRLNGQSLSFKAIEEMLKPAKAKKKDEIRDWNAARAAFLKWKREK